MRSLAGRDPNDRRPFVDGIVNRAEAVASLAHLPNGWFMGSFFAWHLPLVPPVAKINAGGTGTPVRFPHLRC